MDKNRNRSRFKRICVYCGANEGIGTAYTRATEELGRELVRRGIGLVYGGGSKGLMGSISDTVNSEGGQVIGIIPAALKPREAPPDKATVGDQRVVENMHQRKAEMSRESDAFIALPGGFGTLEELLEMITWLQLGFHNKPVGILDVDGYYQPLLNFFDKAAKEGFVTPSYRSFVLWSSSPSELLDLMEAQKPINHSHEEELQQQQQQQQQQQSSSPVKEQWSIAKMGYSQPPPPNSKAS